MKFFNFLQNRFDKSFINHNWLCTFVTMTLLMMSHCLFSQVEVPFNYTGTAQTWTVPAGITFVDLELWGAQGGKGEGVNAVGGLGGQAKGRLTVTPGQVLNIYVGGQGQSVDDGTISGGGYNGGGDARGIAGATRGGGGGGSDIRVGGDLLSDRVIVAGGGGGSKDANAVGGQGGGGFGESGGNGSGDVGLGGFQNFGGTGFCANGFFGNGGSSTATRECSGGGGGWYGSGSGGAAGGGSGYIGGVTNGTFPTGGRTGHGLVKIIYHPFPNDLCVNPIEIQCNELITGSTIGPNPDNPNCSPHPNAGGGLWYYFIGTGEDVTVTTNYNGTNFNTRLGIFAGTCNELICIAEDDGPGDFATVTFFAAVGGFYRILIDGPNGAEGNFQLSVICGNPCESAINLNCLNGPTTWLSENGFLSNAPNCGPNPPGKSKWFRFVGDGNEVTFSTCFPSTVVPTQMSIYTGDCNNLTCFLYNDDDPLCSNGRSIITFCSEVGETYYIAVEDENGASGLITMDISCSTPPPLTVTCPPSQTLTCFDLTPTPAADNVIEFELQGGTISGGSCAPSSYTITHTDVSQTCTPSSTASVIREYTITHNGSGETETCVQLFFCPIIPPLQVTCPPDMTIECDGTVPPKATTVMEFMDQGGSITGGMCGLSYSGIQVEAHDGFTNVGFCGTQIRTRTYTITSFETGESVLCTQIISRLPAPAPTITSNGPITVACFNDYQDLNPESLVSVSFNSGCDPFYTITHTQLGSPCVGSHTVQFTVTDECGRSSSTDQIVNIDNQGLQLVSCPPDLTVGCFDQIVYDVDDIEVVHPCGIDTDKFVFPPELFSGIAGEPGAVYRVEYRAGNDCSEQVICEQFFTVENVPFQVTCPADITLECDVPIPPIATSISEFINQGGSISLGSCLNPNSSLTFANAEIVEGSGCDSVTVTRTYVITSIPSGETAQCVQTISRKPVPPLVVTSNGPFTIECLQDFLDLDLASTPSPFSISFNGNCNTPAYDVMTTPVDPNMDCNGNQSIIQYEVFDECGRTYIVDVIVNTVNDGNQITCPPDMTVACYDDIVFNANNAIVDVPCNSTYFQVNPQISLYSGNPGEAGAVYEVVYGAYSIPCIDSVWCSQFFTIENGPFQVTCPPDRTVECAADVIAEPNQVQVNTPCGEGFSLTADDPVLIQGLPNCSGTTYSITYTATTDTGHSGSCTQIFTIQNAGTQVTVAPDETVECAADISNVGGGIQVTSVCGTLIGIAISDPIISNPNQPDCSGTTYTYNYAFTDECGTAHSYDRVYTIQNSPMQITCPADEIVECEADILADINQVQVTTSCNIGYTVTASAPVLVAGLPNCWGTNYSITYTVNNDCGETATCTQFFSIQNAGTQAVVAPDVDVECAADIVVSENDLQITSPCGLNFPIQISGPVISDPNYPNCSGTTYTYTYSFTDECGVTYNYNRIFTIQNSGTQVTVSPDETVECPVDISVSENDIQISAPCGLNFPVQISGPVISDPNYPNCSGTTYTYTYSFTDECGNFRQLTRVFTIDHGDPQVIGKEDEVVECAADIVVADNDFQIISKCGDTFESQIVNVEISDPDHPDCSGTVHEYTYNVEDECGFVYTFTRKFTIQNNGTQVVVSPDETVECVADISPSENDIQVNAPCGLIFPIQISGPFIDDPSFPNCSGKNYIYRYSFTDECGVFHEYERKFTIQNSGTLSSIPFGETVECAADISVSENDVQILGVCDLDFPVQLTGPVISNPNYPNCSGTTYTYNYSFTDECGVDRQYNRTFTIQNAPVQLVKVDPYLATIQNNSTVQIQCYAVDPSWSVPQFDASAFTALASCNLNAPVVYQFMDLGAADCTTAPFVHRYKHLWTVTDECGTTDEFSFVIELVDNIAPVLIGVPADLSLECSQTLPDIPNVTATDECNCAYISFIENEIPDATCSGNKTIVRTWSASDHCGNVTTASQYIVIKDFTVPTITLADPNITIENGDVIQVGCSPNDYPFWVNTLDENSIIAADLCSQNTYTTFSIEKQTNYACTSAANYLERHQPTWTVTDDCGNIAYFSFTIQIVDTEAPTIYNSDVIFYCGNGEEGYAVAIDGCGWADLWHYEVPVEGCGNGIVTRHYIASDNCGNISTSEQLVIDLTASPQLITFAEGLNLDEVVYECNGGNGNYTNFDKTAVTTLVGCIPEMDLEINFSEKLLPNSCENGGSKLQLIWTATTPCGYVDSLVKLIDIIDNHPPYFPSFQGYVESSCGYGMPGIYAVDDCSEVTLDIVENIISNNGCANEKEVHRTITATDACGMSTTVTQTVKFIDNEGPVFDAPSSLCSDQVYTEMMAYDQCSGNFITATLISEENISSCSANIVLQKTWRATDECGNSTDFVQTIYPSDYQIEFDVLDGGLEGMLNGAVYYIHQSNNYNMHLLDQVDAYSVVAYGACGELLVGEFSKTIKVHEPCQNGIGSTIYFHWNFVEVCGTTYEYNAVFHIINDMPPTLELGGDMNLYCTDVIPELIMEEKEGISYNIEMNDQRDANGNGVVTRTVTATDNCGNTTVAYQNYYFYNSSNLQCNIGGNFNPSCNSHNNLYTVNTTGGTAPYSIEWTVVGGNCSIETVYGNSAEIYVGFGQATIKAKVTDANGCITECEATISCQGTGLNSSPSSNGLDSEDQNIDLGIEEMQIEVKAFPNPFSNILNLNFQNDLEGNYNISVIDNLGRTVHQEMKNMEDGNEPSIDLSELQTGVYHILIENENTRQTIRVVKIDQE